MSKFYFNNIYYNNLIFKSHSSFQKKIIKIVISLILSLQFYNVKGKNKQRGMNEFETICKK